MSHFPCLSLRQRKGHCGLQTPFINSRKTSLWQPRSPPRSPVRSSRLCKAPMTSFTKAVLLLLVAIIIIHDKTQRLRFCGTMAADLKQITNCYFPGGMPVLFLCHSRASYKANVWLRCAPTKTVVNRPHNTVRLPPGAALTTISRRFPSCAAHSQGRTPCTQPRPSDRPRPLLVPGEIRSM